MFYMDAVSELQHLEAFLVDEHERDPKKIENLYECVQYAAAIVPRFVNDLPESDKEPRECDGTVSDAIHFVLVNFAEMNKLWVRMQHQGPSREREKREKDRMELRILVGTNLVRLSQLENLTEDMYVKEVLPSILEQVVSCRDHISQEYLMECVIQVFGDDFHLATLNEFLRACGDLVPEVNVKNILIALIERLALFAANPDGPGIPADIQLFDIFSEQAKNFVKNRTEMPMEDIVSLYAALVSLAIKCYPNRPEFANTSFGSLKCILEEKKKTAIEPFDPIGRELMKLIRLPIDEYNNALKLAGLTEFVPVMETFKYHGRCLAASHIIQNMLENGTLMRTEENVAVMCAMLHSLLVDQQDQPPNASNMLENGTLMRTEENVAVMCAMLHSLLVDQQDQPPNASETEDFEDEQHLVARFVHLIQADTPDEQFLLLNNARKILGAGGKARIKYTLTPIIFELYKLILRFVDLKDEENWEAKMRKMFMCAMGTIGALITTAEMSDLPLKLYLEGAMVADKVPLPDASSVVYEFISKVTEDMLVELISRTKENAVQLDVSAEADALEKHLAMTLQHIKRSKEKRPGLAERLQL
ncbi:vacuolar protein sorting-associated protein 35 [Ostertagia ostertagi]